MNQRLTLQNLTLEKEKIYFAVVLAFAIAMWLALAMTIFGLLIAAVFAAFAWLAQGLLVAQLRADGVKVDERQLPELAGALRQVCDTLQVRKIPDLYIVQSGGLLNAFATRHCGRNFVVLYSEMLEAYGPNSPEIRFLLGHEIGHIRQHHLPKQILLAPGMFVPLIGNAYSRACESSCDRHGAFAAGDVAAAARAMMVLSGGREAGKWMTPEVFASQYRASRGFFVSWYELISGYPTLSQRVANLLALTEDARRPPPGRHPLAYVFALFSFGGRATGGVNLLVTVAVIAILAGMLIPALTAARAKARQAADRGNLQRIDAALHQYSNENDGFLPPDLGVLMDQGRIPARGWVVPGSHIAPPRNGNDIRAGGCDYFYLAKGESMSAIGPESPLVMTRPDALPHGFMHVLYGSGDVREGPPQGQTGAGEEAEEDE